MGKTSSATKLPILNKRFAAQKSGRLQNYQFNSVVSSLRMHNILQQAKPTFQRQEVRKCVKEAKRLKKQHKIANGLDLLKKYDRERAHMISGFHAKHMYGSQSCKAFSSQYLSHRDFQTKKLDQCPPTPRSQHNHNHSQVNIVQMSRQVDLSQSVLNTPQRASQKQQNLQQTYYSDSGKNQKQENTQSDNNSINLPLVNEQPKKKRKRKIKKKTGTNNDKLSYLDKQRYQALKNGEALGR